MSKILKALFCNIMVSKDIMHETEIECFTHEIPLYRARFTNVRLADKQIDKVKELSSVSSEYGRLARKHGIGDERDLVEEVYGNIMVGTLQSKIGLPADEFMMDLNELASEEYEELNKAADEKAAPSDGGDGTQSGAGGEPSDPLDTKITKKALVEFLNDKKIEFDDSMNRDSLIAWSFSALPQFMRAADPGVEIPVESNLEDLMDQYVSVTAVPE